MITITETALKEIKEQAARKSRYPHLRLGVRGGGCTGFSYSAEWSEEGPRSDDKVFIDGDVQVYVDRKSYVYLKGTTLDFETTIMGRGFRFVNPNSIGECSCGESVKF